MSGQRIPVLMYHEVSPRAWPNFSKYVVTPRAFAAQMRWLSLAGYTSVGMDAAVGPPRNLPARPVIITFDDGYQDCVRHVVPILERWGFSSVFFLVTELLGSTSRWLVRERGIQLPLIDWPTARRLDAGGFACASHSMTHPRLTSLSAAECQRELCESRQRLEDELGHEVRDLAYPFGVWDARVRAQAVEAGYRAACSVSIGFACPDDDPLGLRRIPINGQESLIDFIWRLRTSRSLSEWLRARVANAQQRRKS